MVTAAYSVTLDAGRASPLFTIDNRHSVAVTAECGRRRWLSKAEVGVRPRSNELVLRESEAKMDGVARKVVAVEIRYSVE